MASSLTSRFRTPRVSWAEATGILVVLACLAWARRQGSVLNVVTYAYAPLAGRGAWREWILPIAAAGLVALAIWMPVRPRPVAVERRGPGAAMPRVALAAALFACAVALLAPLRDGLPDFALVCAGLCSLACAGWAAARARAPEAGGSGPAGSREADGEPSRSLAWVFPGLLMLAVFGATAWHAGSQYEQWRGFRFGFADFGLFTVELEQALPWKQIGPERFDSTRMGFHCIPMFYALLPLYALFRSPVFLMVIGPLALNLAAWPFYQLARQRCGSAAAGLIAGLGWLALPSMSRLPYAGTYGFQSIYLAAPWLAWCVSLGLRGRWGASHLALAGAVLSEETVCGVALGWGMVVALVERRRCAGLVIVLASAAWLVLATQVVIPHFDVGGRYSRLDLFGAFSGVGWAGRPFRKEALGYLLALLAPTLIGWVRAPRLLLAAAPTLLLILLMQNADYLNIKYWHQTSVLPILYAAAIMGVTRGRDAHGETTQHSRAGEEAREQSRAREEAAPQTSAGSWRCFAALLAAILLFHQQTGFTPLALAYRPFAQEMDLARPDPRAELVAWLQARFDPDRTHVIATERMAAHFTRYRTVRSTPGVDFSRLPEGSCLLVFDRSDPWDPTVHGGQAQPFLDGALARGFRVIREQGPVVVLSRDNRRP